MPQINKYIGLVYFRRGDDSLVRVICFQDRKGCGIQAQPHQPEIWMYYFSEQDQQVFSSWAKQIKDFHFEQYHAADN